MTVALIPFPAAILARHTFLPTAILFYSLTLVLVASQHFVFLRHIYRSEKLRHPRFTPEVHCAARWTAAVGPVCYLAAAALSFVAPTVSFAFILLALFFYIVIANRIRLIDASRSTKAP